MRTRTRVHVRSSVVLAGLALVVASCAGAPPAREAGPQPADSRDLVAIHTEGSPAFDNACLKCHADIMKRTTLNPRFKEAHAAMIPFWLDYDAKVGATNEICIGCHSKVDVIQQSGLQIRKNVEVATCEGCHGKKGTATKKFYAN